MAKRSFPESTEPVGNHRDWVTTSRNSEVTVAIDLVQLQRRLDGGETLSGAMLLDIAKAHVAKGQDREAYRALRRLAGVDRSFATWTAAARLQRRLRARAAAAGGRPVRVSLVGTTTLEQLGELLGIAGLVADLDLDVRVAGYGQYETALMDPDGVVCSWSPDVVVLAPDASAVRFDPVCSEPEAAVTRELSRWTQAWASLRERTTAQILQLNFAPPVERPGGSLDGVQRGSRRRLFGELNRCLADAATIAGVQVVDIDAVSAAFGLERWWEDRYWYHAKQAISLGALPTVATEIAAVLRARVGQSRKCLVVDLDNTLWGGIVGEDGVGNLQLEGTPVGEAHLGLQEYLEDLRRTGVLLAVCSKNDEASARAPFLERQDMRLRLEDFAAFVANWEDKASNLERIASQLGLGLDALVFVDDNPAERALIREMLPEVDVIDLPADPSGYRRTVAQYRGFETSVRTPEDGSRTQQYRSRAAALELQARTGTIEEFLAGLAMVAEVGPVETAVVDRVAQLVSKTNQWNLTTRRHPRELIERWVNDPEVVTVSVRLQDRYADHGLVAVAIAFVRDATLEIDTFLMSCRVIGRTVEYVVIDHLVDQARQRSLSSLVGTYVPTDKNRAVSDLYRGLGFSPLEFDGPEQQSRWQLELDRPAQSRPDHLNIFIETRRNT
jgi:FkbH-like protein